MQASTLSNMKYCMALCTYSKQLYLHMHASAKLIKHFEYSLKKDEQGKKWRLILSRVA